MSTLSCAQGEFANLRLELTYRRIDDLRPDPRNPRKHSNSKIEKLGCGIKKIGFVIPVVVDRELRVVAGHARLAAARKLGMTEVPTICLDHLSRAQLDAFMLADNRLAELSDWDEQKLRGILEDLSLQNLDFSLELTGFEMGEIDVLIEGLDAVVTQATPDKADTVPGPSAGPPVSNPGDVWALGRHRLLCGSALEADSYKTLMGEEGAAMVITDPPYNVPIQGHVSGNGAIQHREFAMASGEMSKAEFTAFLQTALGHTAAVSLQGSIHFVCMDWRHMGELLAAGEAVYTELKGLCVWTKDNAGMGSLYRSQHELVFVYKHGTARHRNNVQLGKHGRNRTNVWRYPGVNSFGRKGEEGNLLALHPTVKPVQLVADAILDCSARGDIVLDPFLGSGTTLIAAERMGRRCFGLELDPLYVDTIIQRWQRFTGDTARHAGSGLSFAEAATAPVTREGGVS